MKALGIFEDVELVLKNMHLGRFFSHHMESYKELTCSWRSCLVQLWRGTQWDFKERSSKVWATIAEESTLPQGLRLLKSGAQCLRPRPTTLDINKEGAKCWRAHHPILCAAGVNPTDKKALSQVGWTSSFARPTSSLSTRSDGRFQFKFTHPTAGPSKLSCPTQSSPQ
ncbi:unnamed protein product [Microthlaspi erraticum]|uniref:Arabidopsis retrotransposon Orf1 C-terminal domain-containing protein n=1 Tax=Microthlaspi erraticum TaxID=1685480 RepID=A0A6D2HPN9_9BRAS|nr:unnamed protein product [Microthlaspi erraticum]